MSSSLTPRTSYRAAPVIETERLVLRPHAATDFDGVYALWADPLVMRHILGRPSTREESWSRLLRYAGHWSLLGFGFWAMPEKTKRARGFYPPKFGPERAQMLSKLNLAA